MNFQVHSKSLRSYSCSVHVLLQYGTVELEESRIHYHNVGRWVYHLQYEEEYVPSSLQTWKTSFHILDTDLNYHEVLSEAYSFSANKHLDVSFWSYTSVLYEITSTLNDSGQSAHWNIFFPKCCSRCFLYSECFLNTVWHSLHVHVLFFWLKSVSFRQADFT